MIPAQVNVSRKKHPRRKTTMTRVKLLRRRMKKIKGTGIVRDKSLNDKLMFINDKVQNYPFSRLQLVVEAFKHSTKPTNQNPN